MGPESHTILKNMFSGLTSIGCKNVPSILLNASIEYILAGLKGAVH